MTKPLALVIEDDYDAATIMSEALQAADYEVMVIHDGETARRQLAVQTPALVALDLHLPHVAGMELLKEIRASERLADTWVMLITADDRLAERVGDDANLILLKPISFTQLQQLVQRVRSRFSGAE